MVQWKTLSLHPWLLVATSFFWDFSLILISLNVEWARLSHLWLPFLPLSWAFECVKIRLPCRVEVVSEIVVVAHSPVRFSSRKLDHPQIPVLTHDFPRPFFRFRLTSGIFAFIKFFVMLQNAWYLIADKSMFRFSTAAYGVGRWFPFRAVQHRKTLSSDSRWLVPTGSFWSLVRCSSQPMSNGPTCPLYQLISSLLCALLSWCILPLLSRDSVTFQTVQWKMLSLHSWLLLAVGFF
jgi:hypothetical protein